MEKRKKLSTSERPLKTSELSNEENKGVFESNRKSQDEGYSSLNSSTFHNGAQAVGPEAVRHASRLGMTCTLTNGARKFRRWRYYRPTRPHLEGPSRLKSTYSTRLAGLPVIGTHTWTQWLLKYLKSFTNIVCWNTRLSDTIETRVYTRLVYDWH